MAGPYVYKVGCPKSVPIDAKCRPFNNKHKMKCIIRLISILLLLNIKINTIWYAKVKTGSDL